MKAGRKKQLITEKELPIMQLLWEHGPMFVREMVERYPEPKPHFNTVATTVRILEEKGHVGHDVVNGSHRFYAISEKQVFQKKSLTEIVSNFFNNSYSSVVSALVEQEKISIDELKEIIDQVAGKDSKK